MKRKRILILGITASGKARLAFALAERLGGEIISADSMKVYRGMDIGTAKPPIEAQEAIPYHLIDVVEPHEAYSVGRYCDAAVAAAEAIESRNRPVVAVGGTALYIKALLHGLFAGPDADPAIRRQLEEQAEREGLARLHATLQAVDAKAAERINPNDARRIVRALEVYELTGRPISSYQTQFDRPASESPWTLIGLRRDRSEENGRINARVRRMIDKGLVDEVRGLVSADEPLSQQAAGAIGYAEVIAHLEGRWDLKETVEKIKINTRRLAKHQRTWFKTFHNVHWIDLESGVSLDRLVDQVLTVSHPN